jgi:hypothetical protein
MKRLPQLLLLLIGIGLLGYLLTVNLKPDQQFTDFLPADTIALLECEHLARTWNGWRQSDIGKRVNKPDFPRLLEQLGLPAAKISAFKAFTAALDRLTNASFFSTLFAERTVVALLAELQGQPFDEEALLRHLVLIAPLGPNYSPQQHQLEQYFGPLRSTDTAVYQGVPLVTLVFQSGRTLSFCQYRRTLICALDPQSVQRCIDQSLNRMVKTHSGLQLNPGYQGLKKRAGVENDFFLYADLAALMSQLPTVLITEAKEMGLLPHHFAIYHQAEAEHDRLSIITQFRQEDLKAFVDRYQLVAPVENSVRQRISSETQLSLWTNWFNLKALWHLVLRMGGHETTALMSIIAQNIFEETGQAIDDFFDVFGNRFGVFINEQRISPLSSNRSVAGLYIEVHDRQKIDGMLKQLFAGLQMVKVITGGTEIFSVIMAGGLLTPAYALIDHYLILADSVGLIEQVQRQGGVKPTVGDKVLVPVSDKTDNFILFVRTKSFAERLIPLLTVLTKETADSARILSPKNRLLIEKALIPLLMNLQSMETSTLRGYAAGEEMMLEVNFSSTGNNSRIF